MNITEPLRLAVGSHRAGSGKGCAMNVISWENGDTTITDMPDCADPMLARIVQGVNDSICTHMRGARALLCPECAIKVLDLAHRTVGTSGHGLPPLDLQRVYVRIAAELAQSVAHLNTDPCVQSAIDAAMAWADNPSANTRAAANAAADAADAAYAAAHAANVANVANVANAANAAAYAAAYAAADAADAVAYAAASVAYAAAGGVSRLDMAHKVIDRFVELAGLTPAPAVDDAKVNEALRQMAQVSA